MNPAVETFIGVVASLLVGFCAIGYFGRYVWKRLWKFMVDWYLADQRAEELAKTEINQRKAAIKEVDETLGNTTPADVHHSMEADQNSPIHAGSPNLRLVEFDEVKQEAK